MTHSPLSPEVLAVLRCPKSQQSLHVASPEELQDWSDPSQAVEGLLINEDGTVAYPIEDGFPILLHDRALTREKA